MKNQLLFFQSHQGHLTIHTNNLGYGVKTYACHFALYTNDFTFCSNLISRAFINKMAGLLSKCVHPLKKNQ